MISLLVTLVIFTVAGAAIASALNVPRLATLSGRLGFWFLLGIASLGSLLFLLGVARVPISAATVGALFTLALVTLAKFRRGPALSRSERHPLAARLLLAGAVAAILFIAAIMPLRDYDGLVTWIPKARAIAIDRSIDGAFFHGNAGLNLHNRYPLLMPLNAATIMLLSGTAEPEAARWMYALLVVAALFAARDLLAVAAPRAAAWTVAAVAWLPIMMLVDGGALSASNDMALFAFGGVALLSLRAFDAAVAPRASAPFLAALVLTKNEGLVIAFAIVLAAVVAGGVGSARRIVTLILSPSLAFVVLKLWQRRVPAAYDEQYDVLVRHLPAKLDRLPEAAAALLAHAGDLARWGGFWIAVAAAALIALASARRRDAVAPLLFIAVVAGVYTITLAVTSWQIAELAKVAVPRLLLHLVLPAAALLAIAGEVFAGGAKTTRHGGS